MMQRWVTEYCESVHQLVHNFISCARGLGLYDSFNWQLEQSKDVMMTGD